MKLKELNVTLEWVTPNAELKLVDMARVSNPQNQGNHKTAPNLTRYLIEHKHWSPFEMANMCVKIETTREISAQIIRHRAFHYQEYSQRYAVAPRAKVPNLRRADFKNRQNSFDDLNEDLVTEFQNMIQKHFDEGYKLYESMLEAGIAKECARSILPLCSPTTMYMSGTLRDWLFYIDVRASKETQYEHRIVANAVKDIFLNEFPCIYEAFFCEPQGQ